MSVISKQPRAFVIIKMTEDRKYFDSFFHFIDRAIKLPEDLKKAW